MSCGNLKRQVVVFLAMTLLAHSSSGVVFALDPRKAITQYVHDAWTTEDGLPQNSILSIAQTRDGYLWVGTWGGLARFDGVRFTVFNRGNTEGLKNNYIYALHEARDGGLWIGTGGGGLTRFRDGKFTTLTTSDGLSSDDLRSICEDREGNLWIGTLGGGLNRFRDGKFTRFTTKEGLSSNWAYSVYEDREGSLWIGTSAGLDRFKDGKLISYSTKDGSSDNIVGAISEDREGGLWVGTWGGLYRFRDGNLTRYTSKGDPSLKSVHSIHKDRDGGLWIGTDGSGLKLFQDGKFTSFAASAGLSHDTVSSIYEDREGSLWIGTWGGLDRLKDGKFTAFTTKEGLSHDWTRCVYEDSEGSLWVGTYGGGLNRLKGGKFTHYTMKNGLPNNIVAALYGDRQGNLWCPTQYGELSRFKDGIFVNYGAKALQSPELVFSMYEDRQGNLWIGTTGSGLKRLRNGKLTRYSTKDGLSHNRITTITEDRQGNLWIGTEGVLNKFRDGKFTQYAAQNGPINITSVYEDREGRLWITTRGEGLIRFKEGEFTTYTTREGLFHDVLTVVLEDGRDNLWIGSFSGIFRVSKKELDAVAQGKSRAVTSTAYGIADGMKNVECNSQQPPGWKSKDGRLWFPTIKGLVVIDPDKLKLNTLAPPVFIEQVLFDRKIVGLDQKAELSPGRRELEIHFTALSFLDPKKVRFKYQLEGYDKNWVNAGTARVAYYTNLSPGAYRFRVIACNNDGVWNESGAALALYLQPHFYETGWFYALCAALSGIAFILVGASGYHLRVKQSREREGTRERELGILVDKRTKDLQEAKRELEEMNQNLEQRVQQGIQTLAEAERMAAYGKLVATVAHEVRNPLFALQTAAYVIEEAIRGPEEVKLQLEVVHQTTERLTSLMDDLLEFARPKPLQLEPTDIEELLKEAVTTYRVEHDSGFPKIDLVTSGQNEGRLKPVLPRIAVDKSRMVQVLVNLIENAAKHARGLHTVTLSAELNQDLPSQICIRVANDGAGIDPENLPQIFDPFFTAGRGTGLGLAIVRQIIKGHGGTITVESEPENGTVFTIHLTVKLTDEIIQ